MVQMTETQKSELIRMLIDKFADEKSANFISALVILSNDIDFYLSDKYDIIYDDENNKLKLLFDKTKPKKEWVWFLHNIALSIIFNSSNKIEDKTNLDDLSLASSIVMKTLFMKKSFDLSNIKLNDDAVDLTINMAKYLDRDLFSDSSSMKTEFDYINKILVSKVDIDRLDEYRDLLNLEQKILKETSKITIDGLKNECESCGLLRSGDSLENLLMIDDIIDSKVDPESLLELAMIDALDVDEYKSWRKMNKNYKATLDKILPGKIRDYDKVKQVVVFLDISLSIDTETLKKYIDIIINVAETSNVNRLIVIKHSERIKSIDIFNFEDDEIDIDKLTKIKNRGGTSHVVPFREALKNEELELEESSLFIFLSDFYSDFESLITKSYFKDLNVPTICVANKDHSIDTLKTIKSNNIPVIVME